MSMIFQAPKTEDAQSHILDLYTRWCNASAKGAYLASLRDYEDHETPEERAAEDLSEALRAELIDCQPRTMPEIAAMLHILWDTLPYVSGDMRTLCDYGAPTILAALWRGASGKEGIPSFHSSAC